MDEQAYTWDVCGAAYVIEDGCSDLSDRPRGEPWDDESQEWLVQRYPALAARFR